jgi:hypothetical protein
VWVLAVLTCFALFGAQPALAALQVTGAGWYFNSSDQEIKFGITAKPQGRFNYFNTVDGANVQGTVTATPVSNPCGTVTPPFIGPRAGQPAAHLEGTCDSGASCTFKMDVVDGGSQGNDFVCHVRVLGSDKKGKTVDETQTDFVPLSRGGLKVTQ